MKMRVGQIIVEDRLREELGRVERQEGDAADESPSSEQQAGDTACQM